MDNALDLQQQPISTKGQDDKYLRKSLLVGSLYRPIDLNQTRPKSIGI